MACDGPVMAPAPVTLVLASANAGKQRELAGLLAPLGIPLALATDWGLSSAEETGSTFLDNALIKARHAAAATRLAALADDSGLEVDALGGRPGVWSARYAGPRATDAQNNARLLAELAAVPPPARTARYRCVLALVRTADEQAPLLACGQWEGRIALAPAGSGGFGYDPLFIPEGYGETVAELPAALKQRLSHRALAAARLLQALRADHSPMRHD